MNAFLKFGSFVVKKEIELIAQNNLKIQLDKIDRKR